LTHHAGHQVSPEREVEVVKRLARTDTPVAALDARVEPRVLVRAGFKIALWTYCEPMPSSVIPPADYAQALECLHAGLRQIEVTTPHVLDRVAAVQEDVADRAVTPDLADTDRTFLAETLRDLGRSIVNRDAPEQLLHGEPHPGNVLITRNGPLFIDFENTAHGPVEYDLGWVPKKWATAIRTPTKIWLARVAASCWRWLLRTGGVVTTSTRAAGNREWHS
jgi:Ser/Thr protein kinase RdoA (MazF antagonist)